MSSEWRTVRVGDLGRIVTGKTPRTTIKENFGGKIPFLTPSDDMSAKYVRKTKRTLSEQGVAEVAGKVLPANSIAVSCIGSNLGKVTITTTETVTNQQINSIIPFESYYDTDFVYYAIKILGERLNFLSKTSTAVPIINKTQFSNETIRVPPLPIQKAISGTLACLDAKIEINNRITANLEQQAQAIFKSWFVDFEPFHDGEFVDSVIGPIPKGWKACAVTDVIDVNPKRKLDKGTSAKYLSMANVSTSGPRVLGWEQRNFTSGTCFMNGDVLLARITPSLEHGKTAFVDFLADQEVGWGSTEFIVMRSREPLPLEYTYCLAKHEPFREHMIKSMTGTSGRQRAQVDALKHYFLAIAPKDVYAEFQEIVIPFFLAIRRNATENQVLAALRDTLLPKLMSGEIEVPVV